MKVFSRLFADTAIKLTEDGAIFIKGKLSPKILREVSLLCSDISLTKGEIWIDKIGRITFSADIDKKFHQRFRNVMFS